MAAEDDEEEGKSKCPDKSEYTLFNPTPKDKMRDFSTDRPTKSNVPYTVDAGLSTGTLASGRTFERFRVENGWITQIEIVVYTSLGKVPSPEWPGEKSKP